MRKRPAADETERTNPLSRKGIEIGSIVFLLPGSGDEVANRIGIVHRLLNEGVKVAFLGPFGQRVDWPYTVRWDYVRFVGRMPEGWNG